MELTVQVSINYLINKGEITVDDKDGLITWIGDDNEVDS